MRVTMLVQCLAMMRGGGETRHLAWAHELAALGVDVDILAARPMLFGGPRYPNEPLPAGRTTLIRSPYTRDFVYRYQRRRGFGRLTMMALHADEERFCRAAWALIASRGAKPDVVHAHALHQAARLRIGDTPVVINLPGEPHPRYRDDLRRADALIADGWAAEQVPRTLGLSVHRVSKGVDADRFQPSGPSMRASLRLERRRVVLAVSRLVPIKRVTLLVEAFATVRARAPEAHLVVVGDGPERDAIRQRAADVAVLDAVTFVGSVPHRETPAFYRAADVFVLSSDFDNSPNVILEAMASGLPIVSTDVGGVRSFVDDPEGGTIVPRGDAAGLAGAIERYVASPSEGRAAGVYNRRKAASDFSWPASAAQLLAVYRRVTGTHPTEQRASA